MKKILILLFAILGSQAAYCQNDYSAFVSEILKEYQKKEAKFKKAAIKEVKAIQEYSSAVLPDSLRFVFIPDLYLKKRSKKFYEEADPANLIEYSDPKAMHMIVFILMDGNHNYLNLYPKPCNVKQKDFREPIHVFYMKYKPKLIFGVCNMPSYFAVIDDKLYAIRYTEDGAVPQTIDEYITENKEDVTLGLRFGYQPLYDPISAGGGEPYLLAKALYGDKVHGVIPKNVTDYRRLGMLLGRGAELIGVYNGHAVNIAEITIVEKLKIFGGGTKSLLKATTVWDPLPGKGYVPGPTSFNKITYIIY